MVHKVSVNVEQQTNLKYLGDEPEVQGKDFTNMSLVVSKMYTWYTYICTGADAKQFLIDYASINNNKALLKKIQKINEPMIPKVAGWVARLLTRGAILDQSSIDYIEKSLDAAIIVIANRQFQSYHEDHVSPRKKQLPIIDTKQTIQDKIHEKVQGGLSTIEYAIDRRDQSFNIKQYLADNQYAPKLCSQLLKFLQPIRAELRVAIEQKDPVLVECYRSYNKKDLKAYGQYVEQLAEDIIKYSKNVSKPVKVAYKKKSTLVLSDKKFKTFKYKIADSILGVSSVPAQTIVGAKIVLTFDVVQKQLSLYVGNKNLDVYGSRLIQFDELLSLSKRVGKSIAKTIDQLTHATDPQSVFANITSTAKPATGKINSNTLLLKASK